MSHQQIPPGQYFTRQYLIKISCSVSATLMYFPPKNMQLLPCLPPGMETPSPITTTSSSCLKPLHPQHTIYMHLYDVKEKNRKETEISFHFSEGLKGMWVGVNAGRGKTILWIYSYLPS